MILCVITLWLRDKANSPREVTPHTQPETDSCSSASVRFSAWMHRVWTMGGFVDVIFLCMTISQSAQMLLLMWNTSRQNDEHKFVTFSRDLCRPVCREFILFFCTVFTISGSYWGLKTSTGTFVHTVFCAEKCKFCGMSLQWCSCIKSLLACTFPLTPESKEVLRSKASEQDVDELNEAHGVFLVCFRTLLPFHTSWDNLLE